MCRSFEARVGRGVSTTCSVSRPCACAASSVRTVLRLPDGAGDRVPRLTCFASRVTWCASSARLRHRRASVRWNGAVVAEAELTGRTPVRFDLPDIALHTDELMIDAPQAPFAPPSGPVPDGPVGVTVGDLELEFLRPWTISTMREVV